MAKVPNGVEILPKLSTGCVARTNVTDDRRMGDTATAYSAFAKNYGNNFTSELSLWRTVTITQKMGKVVQKPCLFTRFVAVASSLIVHLLQTSCKNIDAVAYGNFVAWWSCTAKLYGFYSAPQRSHCKRCTSYGNFIRLPVRQGEMY